MLLADGSVRRSSALQAAGVRPQAIADALAAGRIARSASGAYYLPGACPTPELAGLAAACSRMPKGVACLLSAAYLCGLVDYLARPIWMALPLQVHEAKAGEIPQRVLRWSYAGAFETGIQEREICGTLIRYTGAPRTILDLIRYARHLSGPDIGIGAARRYVSTGGTFDDVLAIASQLKPPKEAERILTVLGTALKAAPP